MEGFAIDDLQKKLRLANYGAYDYIALTRQKSTLELTSLKGIFTDPLIRSTFFSTHTDFIVYSERTFLY